MLSRHQLKPIGRRPGRATGTLSAGQSVPAIGCVNQPSAGPVGMSTPSMCNVRAPNCGATHGVAGRR